MTQQAPRRKFGIELIAAPDDPHFADMQDDFAAVSAAVFDADPHPSVGMFVQDGADASMWMTGAWEFAGPFGTAVIGAIGGWFAARANRKVRLRIRDVEAEASSVAEVEELLRLANGFECPSSPSETPPGGASR